MVDGREGEYTPARLEAMSCDDLQTLLTAGETEEAGLGKVVSGPEWYFALTISSKEHKTTSWAAGSISLLPGRHSTGHGGAHRAFR